MSRLTLATLGTPEVRHGNEVLQFRTRKSLALLIYLAVEGGKQTREKLAVLFWPESDAERGRTMLRRTLAFLRQTLSEAVESLPGNTHLLVERDAIGFNSRSDYRLDVHTLDSAVRGARASLQATDGALTNQQRPEGTRIRNPHSEPGVPLEQLQSAAGLYGGDFLDGFTLGDAFLFDEWVGRQREYWHRRIESALDRLSELQIAIGESAGAKATIHRWLALSPLDEIAYTRLIRLHLAGGDRDAALRAYRTYSSKLSAELDIEPSPELIALAERIRLEAPNRPVSSVASPASPSAPPTTLLKASLVGRGKEFAKLVELYHRAYRGEMQVVILEGEAGIGKTRLATEFLGWAVSREADLLQGCAFETGGRIPYQPLVGALRDRLEKENAPDDLLNDVWLAELSRLLPELRERYPDLPAPIADETLAQTRLFEAVVRLGQALAERAPQVIFIDDLQWADLASLDLLHYSMRRWAESRSKVLVLATLRSEALNESQAVGDWLSAVARDLPLTRIPLSTLTVADTVKWLQSLVLPLEADSKVGAGTAPPHSSPTSRVPGIPHSDDLQEFGEWLFSETNGQPFYIVETLKALLERGVLSLQVDEGSRQAFVFRPTSLVLLSVPSGVREMIQVQLKRLPPAAYSLVGAGAVLGHHFSFEQLCYVAGVDEREALPAVDLALQRRLWVATSAQGSDSFLFVHDKIRDVAYAEIGELTRRIFHRRAMEILERAGTPPAELARHATAAGLTTQTARFSLQAGDDAIRLFAVRDAIVHYLAAYSLIKSDPAASAAQIGLTPGEVQHLYTALGKAHETLNDWNAAERVYMELLDYARQTNAVGSECLALNRLSTVAAQGHFDLEKAAGLLQEAQRLAESSSDRTLLVETEWNLAQLAFYTWHLKEAVEHAERALSLIDETRERELVARCWNTIAYSKMMMGRDWPRVEEIVLRARSLYAELGNRAMEADCLSMLAIIKVNGGMYDEGIAAAREGYSIASRIENPWGQANCTWVLARGLLERGEPEDAPEIARMGVEAARLAGHPPSLLFNLVMLGRISATLFGPDIAIEVHTEAKAISDALKHPLLHEWVSSELCLDYASIGEWWEAYNYALQALERRDYGTVYAGPARWSEIEALARSGELERAAEDLRRFEEQCDSIGYNRRYRIQYLRAKATLNTWSGNTQQAIASLQEAATMAEEIGMLSELWQLRASLARLLASNGHNQEAAYAYEQARDTRDAIANSIREGQTRLAFLASTPIE